MPAKIYAIRNRTSDLVYVGSTEDTLAVRFKNHKHPSSTGRKCASYPIVECPTAYIELLEECDGNVRYERERWWIENTPNVVNKQVPRRREGETKEYLHQWYLEHKEEHDARNRDYVEANRERIREYQRAYRQAHKEEHNARERQRRARLKDAT